jgi:hypothetical protein
MATGSPIFSAAAYSGQKKRFPNGIADADEINTLTMRG